MKRRYDDILPPSKDSPADCPPVELAYAAGVFDGMGGVSAAQAGPSITLHLKVMDDHGGLVAEWLNSRWPMSHTRVTPYAIRSMKGNFGIRSRERREWHICRAQSVVDFVAAILPYTVRRHAQLIAVLEFARRCVETRPRPGQPLDDQEVAWRLEAKDKIMSLAPRRTYMVVSA